jgi:DNA-binding transcriptional LysR family regulator
LAEAIVSACKNAGFSPIVGQQAAPQMSSILNLVAAGLGVSVVPASMRGLLPDVVDYRPLDGTPAPRAPIALARRKIHRNNAVKNFVELVETSGDNGEGRSPEPIKDFAACEHHMPR